MVVWPFCAFGWSVTSLILNVRKGVSGMNAFAIYITPISNHLQENTLQCIEAFRGLERLMVYCQLDDSPSDRGTSTMTPSGAATRAALQAVLDSVRSGSALLSVTVIVRPSNENPGWSYGVDRTGLVDYLLGEEMRAILSRFTALCQLDFRLWEHEGEHDAGWWKAEIARRLPGSCHAAVSVKLDLRPLSASCRLSVGTIAHARHAIFRLL